MIASIYYLLKMAAWFFLGLAFILFGVGWLIWMGLKASWRMTEWMFKGLYQAVNALHVAAYDKGDTRKS